MAIGGGDQGADFAVYAVEIRQGIQSCDDRGDRACHHRYQELALQIGRRLRRALGVLLPFVIRDHFISQNRSEYRVQLERGLNQTARRGDCAGGQRSANSC